MTQPTLKPGNPCFSSGPCAKRPSWNLDALKNAALGRSHRAKIGKAKLAEVIVNNLTSLLMVFMFICKVNILCVVLFMIKFDNKIK